MSFPASLFSGLILSSIIGLVAYRRGSLTTSGVVGAILTGTLIFGFGGVLPGLLLVAFFVSSSLLSHYKMRAKAKFSTRFAKGSQRDLGQALANGGWAAVIAVCLRLAQDSNTSTLLLTAYVGAIATVTADTWSTEIGVLSGTSPRLITTGRTVPAGTSGDITTLGTLAALAGTFFIGVVALVGAVLITISIHFLPLTVDFFVGELLTAPGAVGIILLAIISGLGGALFDSLLGATVQGIYFCEYDEVQTEKKVHTCGRATRLVRGWRWLDNDLVNFSASVVGSLIAFLLANVIFTNAVR